MNDLRQLLKDLRSENAALQAQLLEYEKNIASLKSQLKSRAKHDFALYRTLADFSLGAIYIFQDGRFQYINDSFIRISGYTLDEVNRIDYLELVHPEHRELVRWATEKALAGETEDLPAEPEIQIFHKDGSTRWIRFLPTLIDYQGKPAILANVIDITAQKTAEALLREQQKQYKDAINNIDQALIILDKQHIVTFVNKAGAKIFKAKPEAIQGKPFSELVPRENTPSVAEYLSKTVSGKSQRFRSSLRVTDDEMVLLQIILHPMGSKAGQYGGAFAFINPLRGSEHSESDIPSPETHITDMKARQRQTQQEFITICANCKKIKEAAGTWRTPEAYFSQKLQVHFSHTICPMCIEDLYPGLMSAGE